MTTVTYKQVGGKEFSSIKIDGDDAFIALVTGALNKIYDYKGKEAAEHQSLQPGKKMIKAINASGNMLKIMKGGTFCATGSGDEQYVKFRNFISSKGQQASARAEFSRALKVSGFIDTAHFAKVVANSNIAVVERAFTPADLAGKTAAKIAALLPGKSKGFLRPGSERIEHGGAKDSGKKALSTRTSNEQEWQDTIDGWLAGRNEFTPGSAALDVILRLLEPGFTDSEGRSKGINAAVMYAPASHQATCMYDSQAVPRPRTIAFAHELIHAYYMMTGTRLYKESSPLDELLTAGLPPFHYREISENRFRVLKSPDTAVRQYYKLGTFFSIVVCAHCGKEQASQRRGVVGDAKDCEACGRTLPAADV